MRILAVTSLVLLIGVLSQAAAAESGDKRRELGSSIDYAIALLTAKDYERLLDEFITPDEKKQILKFTTIKEMAPKFAELKADQLLASLKQIRGSTPQMSEDGDKATFNLPEPVGGKKSVIFVREDKLWYIGN